ncbi:MAG: DUF378 domain-containing protein [Bacillota bacterium]|nr:DUF378 domain-containing protein [Bacillota bacterium]
MDRFALVLVIVGAIIWGAVGVFGANPMAWITNGTMSAFSRVIYTIIGLCGLWCVRFLFRERIISPSKHHD